MVLKVEVPQYPDKYDHNIANPYVAIKYEFRYPDTLRQFSGVFWNSTSTAVYPCAHPCALVLQRSFFKHTHAHTYIHIYINNNNNYGTFGQNKKGDVVTRFAPKQASWPYQQRRAAADRSRAGRTIWAIMAKTKGLIVSEACRDGCTDCRTRPDPSIRPVHTDLDLVES